MNTDQALRHAECRVCSGLGDHEWATQKCGHGETNTYLPPAVHQLLLVKDLKPKAARKLQLRQCPECGTYYIYRTDYDYLVNGTEDEDYLGRLSDREAEDYLSQRPSG